MPRSSNLKSPHSEGGASFCLRCQSFSASRLAKALSTALLRIEILSVFRLTTHLYFIAALPYWQLLRAQTSMEVMLTGALYTCLNDRGPE
jgi:hypothetical protein